MQSENQFPRSRLPFRLTLSLMRACYGRMPLAKVSGLTSPALHDIVAAFQPDCAAGRTANCRYYLESMRLLKARRKQKGEALAT
jgi:hypothetical protein